MAPQLSRLADQYPVVTVTGPRQSGKTTLCKMVFPDRAYVSLEDPDARSLASRDPRGFFATYPDGAVIDEVQRVPDLLSYIQGIVDTHQRPGQFILTGSAQFELLAGISQSLAGRTALLTLQPFTYDEAYGNDEPSLNDVLYRGLFPRVHDLDLDPVEAYAFYFQTYVERDVRQLLNIKDQSAFEHFVRLCAGQTGQLLNLSNLANDVGTSVPTAKSWLSVLEASYLVRLLRPHHANFGKRLRKTPKLYFVDTGLAAYLVGVKNAAQLTTHHLRGALVETFVVQELVKHQHNRVRQPDLYFFRDSTGNEVDVLLDHGENVCPVEIKSAATVRETMFRGLSFYRRLNPDTGRGTLVYGGDHDQTRTDFDVLSFRHLARLLPDR